MLDLVAQPDAALMARVQQGQRDAFAELVRRYQPALRRMARSRLGRNDWAEDVVQETFLAAFRGCASYDPQFSFRTWLWTIALNQCHAHYQRRLRSVPSQSLTEGHEPVADARAVEQISPLGSLLKKERSEQLAALLEQLSAVQADALRLRFFGGLKFHEIADAMGCSLNTAKQRVRTGLLRMGQWLPTDGALGQRAVELDEEC